ncbi:AIPR family protein [Caulobacter sp.]|uniref:AIPR family protein n=1 Tax=Caulobacter sp. TaxID=78 RepID=UPI001B1D2A1D|nr:AIPR family protein [Caulobacter sp.]MBO9545633.1 AIPR family protein [Caulobacter sp.]
MADRPVEILALPPKLHQLFDQVVPLKTGGNAEANERDFLSRALAAFVLHKAGGATIEQAGAGIIDGGGDGGIDAIYHSPATNTLWLVQSKYIHAGLSEPDLGDVTKFQAGLSNLLAGRFDAFAANQRWNALRPQIEAVLAGSGMLVRAVLCYSGLALISEDRKRLFEVLKQQVSKEPEDDYFDFQTVNLTTLNDWVTGGDDGRGIESVDLEIHNPGWVTRPYETVYGLVPLERLKALYEEHGRMLVRANIRGFKGRTDVNEDIQKTLREEADHFHYLNNGLTAYCDRFEIHNLDRLNAQKKRVAAKGFAIINGAQTLGSIAKCVAVPADDAVPSGFAFIKIVSLERCEDDRAFAERISRTANFQNHVELRDFAAAYPLHEQLAYTLRPHGIYYHFKIDEDTPKSDSENFSIDDALSACACLKNTNDCDFITRVAANRSSLLSLDLVYPETAVLRSRHERVFPPDLSARTLWRAVQMQTIVLKAMGDSAKAATGATKAFYTYGRWIVLAVTLARHRPEQGEALALTDAEKADISARVSEYAESLLALAVSRGFAAYGDLAGQQVLTTQRDFQSVFKTQNDCRTLFSALKAEVWQTQNAPQVIDEEAAGQS